MNKEHAKQVFRAAGLPIVRDVVMDRREIGKTHVLPPPYVVKPVSQGSSVGVFIVREGDNRPPALLMAEDWSFGDRVMAEEFVPGRELTVAVMGDKALGVTEIMTDLAFYDYEAKYAAGGSKHVCPAKIPESIAKECCRVAIAAHRALGCRGVSRSDFRYDDTKGAPGRIVLLETNTQPGMTPTSLVPELAQYTGMSFGALVRWIVDDASVGR
jgi:D-alanine-D-alanine ligase